MNSKTLWLTLAGVFVVVGIIIGISRFMVIGSKNVAETANSLDIPTEPKISGNVNSPKTPMVMVGGVLRPATDVKLKVSEVKSGEPNREEAEKLAYPYGKQRLIDPAANPNVASVYEALKENIHPERLSPFIPPAPFDPKLYDENPQKYLDVVEPGRVWQSAQPATGVPVIEPATKTYQAMKQGESIALKVLILPGKPATFTSFDLGAFDNNLNSISVAADDMGIATANFTATPGTIAQVKILAASPVASSNVRFTINIANTQN